MAEKTAPIKRVNETVEESFKFTLNIKGKGESLTIRTNDETELETLRTTWADKINPKRADLPKMFPGDECPDENCQGHMIVKTTNGKVGQKPYAFLSCDKFPTCKRTAYIATFNDKEKPEKVEKAEKAATVNGQV